MKALLPAPIFSMLGRQVSCRNILGQIVRRAALPRGAASSSAEIEANGPADAVTSDEHFHITPLYAFKNGRHSSSNITVLFQPAPS